MEAAEHRPAESPAVEPVRVLVGNDHLGYGDALHGVGRYLLNILSTFDPERVHAVPVILRPEPRLSRFFEDKGIPIRCLGRNKLDPRALLDLVRIIREERIEVIHVQALKSDTLGRIAGLVTGVPTIIHGRDRIADRPRIMEMADRLLGPSTRHALAVSETVRRYLRDERYINEDRIEVFYHGVDLSVFAGDRPGDRESVRAEFGIPSDAPVAGTTIRLHPSKGHVHLLEGAAQVVKEIPDFRLLIANEGPEADRLAAETRRLELDGNVVFTGSRRDVRAFLSALDVFVMPSLSEGFPNSMLEAMAMGRPVIATNVDGMGEMLSDEKDALVVPPADGTKMANALLRVLRDPLLREELSRSAQRFADALSIERTVARLSDLYLRVARGSEPD